MIIFSIIASLKAFYLIYLVILFPLLRYIIRDKNLKDFKFFFNRTLSLCVLLIGFVFLTNIFNTGCFLFPRKKHVFFNYHGHYLLRQLSI